MCLLILGTRNGLGSNTTMDIRVDVHGECLTDVNLETLLRGFESHCPSIQILNCHKRKFQQVMGIDDGPTSILQF